MTDFRHIVAYRVVAPPVYFSHLALDHLPVPGVEVGDLAVAIERRDPDGDISVVFEDGRVESIAWGCLDPDDSGRGRFLRELLVRELHLHDDVFEAIDGFTDVIALRRRLAENAGKVCSSCKEFKHFSEFGKDAARDDGLSVYCKECKKTINARQREQE